VPVAVGTEGSGKWVIWDWARNLMYTILLPFHSFTQQNIYWVAYLVVSLVLEIKRKTRCLCHINLESSERQILIWETTNTHRCPIKMWSVL
jgi:hypothetical protein